MKVSVKEVLVYLVWFMGLKINIDLVILMNKGFELIEVYYLFGFGVECFDVLVYLEVIVYGLV